MVNKVRDADSAVFKVNFFSGGAGVGKSFLILTIASWTEKIMRQHGDNPSIPKVLLMGPTGMAASLIGEIIFEMMSCNE